MRLLCVIAALTAVLTSSCDAAAVRVRIDPTDQYQVIHSFGASDAWRCDFVGKHWPVEKRNAIADLLLSRDFDAKGNPRGIGLSMWRFYLGAGSTEQAEKSGIGNSWRRAECFQNPDGSYDWSKHKGQQWFLEAAKARGVEYFLAFTNAPPVQHSLNGIAHSDKGRSTMNIKDGALPEYARFLVDVAEHFYKRGITFHYISPVNEPQWGWDSEKQEGTPASNAELYELTRLIADDLSRRKLPSKVALGESGDIEYLSGLKGGAGRSDQIKAFWDQSSQYYLGELPNVARVISGHSYWTTWPISRLVESRNKLAGRAKQIDPKLAYWQTEFCILESNDEIGQGAKRDLGMDTALYVARVIHADLTIANAAHWSWWTAVSECDYKDGLVYLDYEPDYAGTRTPEFYELQRSGRVLASKTLWAMGNFSRFVRPGMVRIGLSYSDNRSHTDAATSLMASAYRNKKTDEVVVVLINNGREPAQVGVDLPAGARIRGGRFVTYTTSAASDLSKGSSSADLITVPARAVVTAVGRLEPGD